MRSRRRWLEWSCRIAAFALLGWLFGESAVPTARRRVESARGSGLAARLAAWTRAPSSVALHAVLDAAPGELIGDWLAARCRVWRHARHAGRSRGDHGHASRRRRLAARRTARGGCVVAGAHRRRSVFGRYVRH